MRTAFMWGDGECVVKKMDAIPRVGDVVVLNDEDERPVEHVTWYLDHPCGDATCTERDCEESVLVHLGPNWLEEKA